MSALGGGKAKKLTLQADMLKQWVVNGWLLGKAKHYNLDQALYPEELLGFMQDSQPAQWKKFCAMNPRHLELHFLEWVASQPNKTAPNLGSARAVCIAPALSLCEPAKAMAE